MFGYVVEIVACDERALQLLTRIAEGTWTLAACRRGRKDLLLSAPPCRNAVTDARVVADVEALVIVAVANGWRGEPLETVDHHDRRGFCRVIEHAEFLGRETLAASIGGRHPETIHHIGHEWQGEATLAYLSAIVITPVSYSHIDVVACGLGRGLVVVLAWHPRKGGCALLAQGDGEILWCQGLHHHLLLTVCLCLEAQYRLVDRTGEGKLEIRVVSQFHIRKTLVRQSLEDSRGHRGIARLAVVAVVEVSPCPLAVVGAEVFQRLVEQPLGKVLRVFSRDARGQFALIEIGGADSERTMYGLHILVVSCIRMYGEAQVDRHVLALVMGIEGRTAIEPVKHLGAHVDVVLVIVLSIVASIHAVGCACPLGIIACSLETASHATRGSSTGDIAHTTAKAHGIGSDDTLGGRTGRDDNLVGRGTSCIEIEGAEIHPRASAHLLVYVEICPLSLVIHAV